MEKPVQVPVKNIKSSETCILLKLYEKGRLGKFPQAENRLRAGLMFMKDFRFSLFSQKTTRSYDKFGYRLPSHHCGILTCCLRTNA